MRPATDSSAARGLAMAHFYRPAREAVLRFALLLLLPLVIMSAGPAEAQAQTLFSRPTDSRATTLAEFRPAATASRGVVLARRPVSGSVRWGRPIASLHEKYTRETGDISLTPPTAKTPTLPAYDRLLKFYPRENLGAPLAPPQAMSVGTASNPETVNAAAKRSYAAAPDSLLNKRLNQALRRAALEESFKKGGVTDEQYRASKQALLMTECVELLQVTGEKGARYSATVADLVLLLPDGSLSGTKMRATVVGTTPGSLLTWLNLGDSITALLLLHELGHISRQDFDTKLKDIGSLEDQIAPLLPLSLEGVVFTVRTATEAGLRGVKDFDVQPFPDLGTIRFVNERDPAPQSILELIRNWIGTTVALISSLCAVMGLALGVWQASKGASGGDNAPAGGERPGPGETSYAAGDGAQAFDLSARLEACRAAARARGSGLTG